MSRWKASQSSCVKKIAYDTKKQARDGASQTRKKFGSQVEEYKCRFCEFYHVGTPKKILIKQWVAIDKAKEAANG